MTFKISSCLMYLLMASLISFCTGFGLSEIHKAILSSKAGELNYDPDEAEEISKTTNPNGYLSATLYQDENGSAISPRCISVVTVSKNSANGSKKDYNNIVYVAECENTPSLVRWLANDTLEITFSIQNQDVFLDPVSFRTRVNALGVHVAFAVK